MSPRPQSFDAGDAERYGLDGAVMLNHFRYWLNNHIAADRNIYDGEVWNHIAVKKLAELYPYWTVAQVRRILDHLEKEGALKSGNYNQKGYDRTLWYTIPGHLAKCDPSNIHLSKSANGNAETSKPIPESYQGPNTENPPSSPPTDDIDAEFELWWKLVPRKVGKGQARTKYRSARKKAEAATLREGIERYAALVKRKGTEPQFIAHPATWLHGERWLDEEPQGSSQPYLEGW